MRTFKIDDYKEAICWFEKTRSGFRHIAVLMVNGIEQEKVKVCYLNRTWESFEFETVLRKLLDKVLTPEEKTSFFAIEQKNEKERIDSLFGTVANIAEMGKILCKDTKEKNAWKVRVLKASGIEIPDEFDSLDEDEKAARLDKLLDVMKERL